MVKRNVVHVGAEHCGRVVNNGLFYFKLVYITTGDTVGSGTALQGWRSRVRFPMASLEFFIDTILPTALWPWGLLSL